MLSLTAFGMIGKKTHTDKSSECGTCDELETLTVSGKAHKAEDYSGRYNEETNCMDYPSENPRICLKYEPRTTREKTFRRLSDNDSGNSKCESLLTQINEGDCSAEDLMKIDKINDEECTSDMDAFLGAEIMTSAAFKDAADLQQMKDLMKVRKAITKYRKEFETLDKKRSAAPAKSDLEKQLCFSCDFTCGKDGALLSADAKMGAAATMSGLLLAIILAVGS